LRSSCLIASLIAFIVGSFSVQGHAEETTERPARAAQCFLEIKGIRYGGGDCLFKPLDKVGSFRIEFEKGLSAQVRVKVGSTEYVHKLRLPGTDLRLGPGSKEVSTVSGDASWSGPQGGDATAPRGGLQQPARLLGWLGPDRSVKGNKLVRVGQEPTALPNLAIRRST
jgi:hypothetical protein